MISIERAPIPDRATSVLLIAGDLNVRRFLYAELREAGYDVTPLPGLAGALQTALPERVGPAAIVIDVSGDPDATPEAVEALRARARGAPLVVIAGALGAASWAALPQPVTVLRRPVTIGEVVEALQGALRRSGGGG